MRSTSGPALGVGFGRRCLDLSHPVPVSLGRERCFLLARWQSEAIAAGVAADKKEVEAEAEADERDKGQQDQPAGAATIVKAPNHVREAEVQDSEADHEREGSGRLGLARDLVGARRDDDREQEGNPEADVDPEILEAAYSAPAGHEAHPGLFDLST